MTLAPSVLLLSLSVCAFAQTAPKFEVATIKPTAPDVVASGAMPSGPSRITFQNMTLRSLVYYAYGNGLGTAMRVTGGPEWANKNRYDIQGLAQGTPTQLQFRAMLRSLLEDRFVLKTHRETESIDVFALVPVRSDGKLGPKVTEWDGTCVGGRIPGEDDPKIPRCATGYRPPGLVMDGVTMFAVAEMLSLPMSRNLTGRIVEDRTELTGRYKMELEFAFAPPDPAGPSLFTALREQWGLKLEAAKGPLEVVVVDGAELPTEN